MGPRRRVLAARPRERADVTFTKSDFKANAGNGNGLALAPKQTYSGGLSARHELGPAVVRGGLRFYGITDRPANDAGDIVAKGFTLFDVSLTPGRIGASTRRPVRARPRSADA